MKERSRRQLGGSLQAIAILMLVSSAAVNADTPPTTVQHFDIPAQSTSDALNAFSRQSGLRLLFSYDAVEGRKTDAIRGEFTAQEALGKLLAGTGLHYEVTADSVVLIREPQPSSSTKSLLSGGQGSWNETAVMRLAQVEREQATEESRNPESQNPGGNAEVSSPRRQDKDASPAARGIPEILVTGSRILNMDIARSRDDAQSYVIFERETIERSGADTLEEFLKYRLTMNTQAFANSQAPTTFGTSSATNLRGLGAAQTLVLIDGHRIPGFYQNSPTQADMNSIPLAAIERVEVLATTASGIYGGGATGGVINVILRRDYTGAELKMSYENAFDTDAAVRRLDFSGGFQLEGGRTDILLSGSYSDQNTLLAQDRGFDDSGRARILANNPAFFLSAATPPLGATTNIRSLNGSPLFGPGTPNFTSIPVGYAGGGGLAPLQTNAGTYNLDLADTTQVVGNARRRSILNAPTTWAASASVRRELTQNLHFFIDVGASQNEGHFDRGLSVTTFTVNAAAPNNPFGQAISVAVPIDGGDGLHEPRDDFEVRNDSRRAIAGFIIQLPRDWRAEADFTWGRTRTEFALGVSHRATLAPAVADGTLDVLRDLSAHPLNWTPFVVRPGNENSPFSSTLNDSTVRLAGPVGVLPAGRPTVSLLLEHREEFFGEAKQTNPFFSPPRVTRFPSRSQSVSSAYSEVKLPLVSSLNRVPGIRELELQIATRIDEYKVNGVTTSTSASTDPVIRVATRTRSSDPTLGLRYQPLPDIVVRASYGTGFFAPTVSQLVPSNNVFGQLVIDPRRGNQPAIPLVRGGGSPDLEPENSESFSAGLVLTPRVLPAVRLSVDYTHIEKTDNIVSLTSQQMVDNESAFPDRITRAPVAPGDPFGVGPLMAVDVAAVNVAEAEVEAYDVALDYRIETQSHGAFDFSAMATWQTHFTTRLLPSQPTVENVGIGSNSPLKLKANLNLGWEMGGWALSWATCYFDSYLAADPDSAAGLITLRNQGGSGRVPSQIYHDLFARYRFDSGSRTRLGAVLANTDMQLGIRNIFNKEPPFDAGANGSILALYSPFGDPRLATYQLSVRKQF